MAQGWCMAAMVGRRRRGGGHVEANDNGGAPVNPVRKSRTLLQQGP
jgi:hypothetical protein